MTTVWVERSGENGKFYTRTDEEARDVYEFLRSKNFVARMWGQAGNNKGLHCVGVFYPHQSPEQAMKCLQDGGNFDVRDRTQGLD